MHSGRTIISIVLGVLFVLSGEYAITPVGAAGAGQLSGMVYYNDTPISAITAVEPSFWVYDGTLNQSIDDFTHTYNNLTGAYTVGNLPVGPVTVALIFHVTGATDTLPGNYRSSASPDLSQLTSEQCADYPIDALLIIHQTSPWDNSGIDFATAPADPYPVHSRHVVYQWDAVPGADHYEIGITKFRDTEHPQGFGYIEYITIETIQAASYTIDLEDSAQLEHYHSYITAYNAGNETIAYYSTTYTNGYGSDYRFKVQEYLLSLDKVKIKAGKTAEKSSFSITGRLSQYDSHDFANGQSVTLQLGDLAPWTINQPLKQSGQKAKYSYKGTPNLKLDLEKGTFKVWAKNVDLTGLAAPAVITLSLGSYEGMALAADEGEEDVINGKKPMPLQFLAGQEDVLRVDKAVGKQDEAGKVKTLVVQGGICLAGDTDLDQVAGTIYWGNQQYPIPLGGLAAKGNGKYLYTEGAGQSDSSVAYVMIDLNKYTFKIGLKNTTMTWQESPVDLRLQLGNFDQTDEAEF